MDRDPSAMAEELATLARLFGDRVHIGADGAVTIEREQQTQRPDPMARAAAELRPDPQGATTKS